MDIAYEIDEYNRTRRERGEPIMTQQRLAELAGVHPSNVSRHIHGYFGIAPATAARYRRALKLVDSLGAPVPQPPEV